MFACSLLAVLAIPAQAPAQDTAGWALGLNVGETYDTNVRFRSEGLPNEFVSRFSASLARGWLGPRHSFALSASGTEVVFTERKELNRLTYAAGATLDLKLSNRAGLTLSDHYTDSLTNLVDDFATEGAIFSLTGTRRNRAAANLKLSLTPQTGLTLDARHDLWDFEDPELENGWRVSTGAGLTHRFNERQTGSLTYGYARNQRTAAAGEVHNASLEWSQALGSRLGLTGSVGGSHIRAEGQAATRLNWGGGLAWRFERGSLAAGYSRRSKTSFGLGRQRVVDSLRADLSLRLTRSVGASLLAGYARSNDPFDPTFILDAQNYGASLSWAINTEFGLSGAYNYLKRETGGAPQDAHRVSASLAYRKAF